MKYIYLSIVVLGTLCSCHHKNEKDTDITPPVNVAQVQIDSVVLHKDYPGYLEARIKADVVGEVSGRLLSKNFESGSYVTKGQVLFTIDPTKYRDAVAQAAAQLESATSQRDFYRKQSAAMEKAYSQDAVSKMELLQSQASLRQAEASMRSAAASLDDARTSLGKCSVKAPISGYITLNELSVGNYVNGEGAPVTLATIYDNSEFDAVFSIEEDQYRRLCPQGISASAGPMWKGIGLEFKQPLPHDYTADLYYVAPSVNSSTGTLQLVGRVRNIDNELKDGMFVTVSLPYGTSPHAVVIKDAAISTDQLGKYVYVVNDSDKVVYTPVTLGPIYRDSLRVVEKGLKKGDRYVTQALLTVRNGMRVKPVLKK